MLKKTILARFIALVIAGGMFITAFVYKHAEDPLVNKDPVFKNELHITLINAIPQNGQKIFSLTLQKGANELFRGKETTTWGVNMSFFGPRIHFEGRADIQVTNRLRQKTKLRWQVMNLPTRAGEASTNCLWNSLSTMLIH